METITIKKEEYERLKIENKTLKKELENTKEPTEFLGKKASEWLVLADLINEIISYSEGHNYCSGREIKELTYEKIQEIIKKIKEQTIAYNKMSSLLVEFNFKFESIVQGFNKNES